MRNLGWVMIPLFILVLVGATWSNIELIGKSRQALTSGVFRQKELIPSARFHLVLIVPDSAEDFFVEVAMGIHEQAPRVNGAVQTFTYPVGDLRQAGIFFDIAVQSGVHGIIMYVEDRSLIPDLAAAAASSGTLFLPFGRSGGEDSSWNYFGLRSADLGRAAGDYIGTALGSSARVGAILQADQDGQPVDAMTLDGLALALREKTGRDIIGVVEGRTGLAGGEEAALLLLQDHPGLNAIYCSSVDSTMGAAQVLIERNLVGRILIVGNSMHPEIKSLVDKGIVGIAGLQDATQLGIDIMARCGYFLGGLH